MVFASGKVASRENLNKAVHGRTALFRNINENEVSPVIGNVVDNIILSGKQGKCDEFFDQIK